MRRDSNSDRTRRPFEVVLKSPCKFCTGFLHPILRVVIIDRMKRYNRLDLDLFS